MKEEDIDYYALLAEDEARSGRFGELIQLLRDPAGRPLTRGERLLLADILDGTFKRPKKRPAAGYSDVAEEVRQAIEGHLQAGKSEKAAVSLVAEAMKLSESRARKLRTAAKKSDKKLDEQAPRVIADILKRGFQ